MLEDIDESFTNVNKLYFVSPICPKGEVSNSLRDPIPTRNFCPKVDNYIPMIGENRQLVTNEPVEFEK